MATRMLREAWKALWRPWGMLLIGLGLVTLLPWPRLFAIDLSAQVASGLDSRPENRRCTAFSRPRFSSSVALEEVFAEVSFTRPVGLHQAPGETQRWFVVEQPGRIKVLQAGDAQASVFADLRERISSGGERGLLGLAFHPRYQSNGEVFLSYTDQVGDTVIARFQAQADGSGLDIGSERRLLHLRQPYANHNGGHIAFGPDGFLYIGLGDGGSAGDPEGNGQDPRTLLGSILRIDVDRGRPYAIPAGNPFADSQACSESTPCPEIYAWGMRNPWRFSLDFATGSLWVADVGQNRFEEITVVRPGDNCGWHCYEGLHPFNLAGCAEPSAYRFPLVEYAHESGDCSVTGGFVYRGTELPGLQGTFIYGDYCSGKIWGIAPGQDSARLLHNSDMTISSFGQDHRGELYVLDHASGSIARMVAADPSAGAGIPKLLSETGYVRAGDPSTFADCFIPYQVNAALWSDGADKQRGLAVPEGKAIRIAADGDLMFPRGSVLIKEFSLRGRGIETRVFMRHGDGGWAGYSYAWREDGSDAELVPDGRTAWIDGQAWRFPSPDECLRCHTQAAGRSLGLELAQLNGSSTYPSTGRQANQVETLASIGLFENPPSQGGIQVKRLYALTETAKARLEDRVRSYLHANCANCHRPAGPARGRLDLRFSVPLAEAKLMNEPPTTGNLGIDKARLLVPGDASRSILLQRMRTRGAQAMPPLASTIQDVEAMEEIAAWIESFALNPDCAVSASNLDVTVPCAKLGNDAYSFELDFVGKGKGSGGEVLWKLDTETIETVDSCKLDANRIQSDLDMSLDCLAYKNAVLAARLSYLGGTQDDPEGHYWRLDAESLKLKRFIVSSAP